MVDQVAHSLELLVIYKVHLIFHITLLKAFRGFLLSTPSDWPIERIDSILVPTRDNNKRMASSIKYSLNGRDALGKKPHDKSGSHCVRYFFSKTLRARSFVIGKVLIEVLGRW